MLPAEDKETAGFDKTGFNENYWVGLSLLHTLFVKEDNSTATTTRGNPTWDRAPVPHPPDHRRADRKDPPGMAPRKSGEPVIARTVTGQLVPRSTTDQELEEFGGMGLTRELSSTRRTTASHRDASRSPTSSSRCTGCIRCWATTTGRFSMTMHRSAIFDFGKAHSASLPAPARPRTLCPTPRR